MDATLTQFDARRIINTVGAAGQPPSWGAHLFTDAFEETLALLDQDYFSDYLKQGGSVFKLVVGHYGGGKTHFLYLLRQLAWKNDYAAAYVSLNPDQAPFHRLDLVYRAIASALTYPPDDQMEHRGLMPLLKATVARWTQLSSDASPTMLTSLATDSTRELENLNFQRAMQKALEALIDGDEETAEGLVHWLSSQGFDRARLKPHGILAPIDRSSAFSCLRSLARWVRQAGYSGLVILFDEAERTPSLSGRQKEFMLSNLRELIDESARGTLAGAFVAYAVPDYRFFDGKTGVYEAVKQRTASMFDMYNPSGVRIDLETLVDDVEGHLASIGRKLWRIMEIAYAEELDEGKVEAALQSIGKAVLAARFADISFRRLFVQSLVRGLEQVRRDASLQVTRDWADDLVDHYVSGGRS